LLAQRKRTKRKGTQPLVPPQAGFPALLDAAGRLQTRCAQTVQAPFSAASAVLGCVTMGKTRPFLELYGASRFAGGNFTNLVWFFSPPHDLSKCSAVPQMRERGLFAIHTVCEQADDKADAVLLDVYSQPKRPVM
jgi:hypothetical protein